MFVHQTWKESRLKLPNDIFEEGDDYVTLPPEFFDNLWQPDPYFLNSKIAGKRNAFHRLHHSVGVRHENNIVFTYFLYIMSIITTLTNQKSPR